MTPALEDLPRSVCLRITRRCNAACSFCQAPPTSRFELTTPAVAALTRFFAVRGVRSIKLSGGEPTVRGDLPDLVRLIADAGPRPVVITNGMNISRALLDACAEQRGELKFSVHRASAENDLVLGRRSFAGIRENMRRVAALDIRLSVNSVVTPATRPAMARMVDFALSVGAAKISFIPVVPRGRAVRHTAFDFTAEGLDAVREEISTLAVTYQPEIRVRCIDIRNRGYWVVENDGSLWIERATEAEDVRVQTAQQLNHLVETP
jgi:molybdenum cofactor biosynthesis enzyme MoaA